MKRIFSILVIALMVSCSPSEDSPKENCNCKTVVRIRTLNIYSKFLDYRNDCTGEVTNGFVYHNNTQMGDKICD